METSGAETFSAGKAWFDQEHGITRIEFTSGTRQTLGISKEAVDATRKVNQGIRRPLLVDLRNVKSVDQDGRSYYSGPESRANWNAAVILTDSAMTNALANMWLAVFNTLYGNKSNPIKLFTDVDAAIAWLKGFNNG